MSTQLSPREKVLAGVVGGIVGLFISIFLISYFFRNHAALKSDLETKQATLQALQGLLTDAPLWQERDAWLNAHQPKLDNQDRATVRLLDEVDEVAKKHVVTITQPQHGLAVHKPEYTGVTVSVEAKADWKNLVDFLYELQGPEKFIVCENADLQIDPADKTRMEAKLMVAKWYAPK
jgi:Type II secretion system (T2SS), protein M subtype b